jgi:hypothetical protein
MAAKCGAIGQKLISSVISSRSTSSFQPLPDVVSLEAFAEFDKLLEIVRLSIRNEASLTVLPFLANDLSAKTVAKALRYVDATEEVTRVSVSGCDR